MKILFRLDIKLRYGYMEGGGAGHTRLMSSVLGDELTVGFEFVCPCACLRLAHVTITHNVQL